LCGEQITSDSEEKSISTAAVKTVYLIRHAESDENRRLHSLSRILQGCTSLTPPTKSDVVASMELLNVQAQIDSDVSEIGRRQINQLGLQLEKSNFVEDKGIQLVVHSPLKRARQTSEGMLGCVTPNPGATTDSSAEGAKASSVSRVIELDILKERTPLEWLPTHHDAFRQRIASFEEWLGNQPEDVIAVVGHSQYFKSMLNLSYKFGNCDVWELRFEYSASKIDENNEGNVNQIERKIDVDVDNEDREALLSSQTEDVCADTELSPGWSKLKNLYSYDATL